MGFSGRSVLVAVAATLIATPLAAQGSSAAEREVVVVVERFLSAMKAKDAASMTALVDSTTRFALLRPAEGGPRILLLSGTQFVSLAADPSRPAIDERIRDPEVRVDGDLATVWTPYQVVRGDRVSHCGTDAFQLARVRGAWKIVSVSDTFRQDGCGTVWDPGD